MKKITKIAGFMFFCILPFFSYEKCVCASAPVADAYETQFQGWNDGEQEYTDKCITIENKELRTGAYMEDVLIELYDTKGNLKASWLTSDEPYVLSGFEKGTYFLTKSRLPEGVIPSADRQIVLGGNNDEMKIVLLDEVKELNVLVIEKGSGKNVSGGILSLYKIPDGTLSYKERVHAGTRCYIKSADEESGSFLKEKGANDLLLYLTNAEADRTELRDHFDTEITFEYIIPKEVFNLENSFIQKLPAGVVPADGAKTKCSAEFKGEKALNCSFREKGGVFYLEAEFNKSFLKESLKEGCSFGITFDAVIDRSLVRAGGCLKLWVKEDVFLNIGAHDIKNMEAEVPGSSGLKELVKDEKYVRLLSLRNGSAVIRGIDTGRYAAVLTETPDGYRTEDDVQFLFVDGDDASEELTFKVVKKQESVNDNTYVKDSVEDKDLPLKGSGSDNKENNSGNEGAEQKTDEKSVSPEVADKEEIVSGNQEDKEPEADKKNKPEIGADKEQADDGPDEDVEDTAGLEDDGPEEDKGETAKKEEYGEKGKVSKKVLSGMLIMAGSIMAGIGVLILTMGGKDE